MFEKLIEYINSINSNIRVYEDGKEVRENDDIEDVKIEGVFRNGDNMVVSDLNDTAILMTTPFTITFIVPITTINKNANDDLEYGIINEYKNYIDEIRVAIDKQAITNDSNTFYPILNGIGYIGQRLIKGETEAVEYYLSGILNITTNVIYSNDVYLSLNNYQLTGVQAISPTMNIDFEAVTSATSFVEVINPTKTSDAIIVTCYALNSDAHKLLYARYNNETYKKTALAVVLHWKNIGTTAEPNYLISRSGDYYVKDIAIAFTTQTITQLTFTLVRSE